MKFKYSYMFLAAVAVVAAAGAVSAAQQGGVPLLDSLEQGLWQLRPQSGAAPVSRICLGDVERLTRLQHGSAACEQYVVRSSPNSVTISYSCKGEGQGLTTIRKESNRIIHIQSQGIRNNAPFSFAVEGRKIGPC